MHHDVHVAPTSGIESALEVLEEVVAAPAAHDARTGGRVEAEVRVGHEEHAHVTATREETPA